ncbi:MAG TPA: 4Fe-4S dicluster domain-containing protein [Phycisphaerae bacterium]|nr:4Fe-4S dicluster domain-containing protein [Phycisphaerae bacterium]
MSFLANLLGPRQAFDGGLFLPDHKALIARQPIETLSVDGPLNVPLSHGRDFPTRPNVALGERVVRGQPLATPAKEDSLATHAPIAGTVATFAHAWSPDDGLLESAIIDPDGSADEIARSSSWEDESFVFQLQRHGVMCNAPRRPLHALIREAVARGATELIVNAMETEPHLAADLRTIVEEPGRIIDTICELADGLGVVRAILAVPFRHQRVLKRLTAEAAGRFIEVIPLPDVYPQCHPVLLVKSLLEREIAPGGAPLDQGVVVLPLGAIRAAADALLEDRPPVHVLVTVSGDAVERPGVYRVAIGTPLPRLMARVGVQGLAQAIWGGPLTGQSIDTTHAVVTSGMTGLLLFSARQNAEPTRCIRCGWCVEDCPVGIVPPDLLHLEARTTCSPLDLAHLKACIDCGLCTHICPSQLPLAQTIRRTRTRFEHAGEATVERVA